MNPTVSLLLLLLNGKERVGIEATESLGQI
jgi:hypothetical protein